MELNAEALQAFMERFAADQAATMHSSTVVLGDQLGLYRAMAAGGPQTPDELADRAGCHPRLVQEWLGAQLASQYCVYDPDTGRYLLTPEQAACLADPSSPTLMVGSAVAASSTHKDTERVRRAFSGDGGMGWGEHHPDLFSGTERFFAPAYRANLVPVWIPALQGIAGKLASGARVADVGCGHGAALILLAQSYPDSHFVGFDPHDGSIEAARKAAAEAGVGDRVDFQVAGAGDFPGSEYDLICVFNALHEWGDPVGAARRIHAALAAEGSWMFTEPRASDRVEENVTVFNRTFYSVSTSVCTPSALAQGAGSHGPGRALGAQAGESALCAVATEAGFGVFRRVAETPAFMVLEARR